MAKKKIKVTVATVLSVLAIVLSGGAIARQFSKEETKEVSSFSYTIGAVNEEGKIDKSDKSSITSDKFKAKDFSSVKIDEDANVTAFVYWYDEDGALLNTQEIDGELTQVQDGAETFRVSIEPNDDEDGEISAFEKSGYAKLVTVTLKK